MINSGIHEEFLIAIVTSVDNPKLFARLSSRSTETAFWWLCGGGLWGAASVVLVADCSISIMSIQFTKTISVVWQVGDFILGGSSTDA